MSKEVLPRSECRSWLLENKFYVDRKRGGAEYNYTLFNNGILYIPPEKHEEFLKKLANDLRCGESWFLNEYATEVTPLYMDCDFKDYRPPNNSEICPCTKRNLLGEFAEKTKEVKEHEEKMSMYASYLSTSGIFSNNNSEYHAEKAKDMSEEYLGNFIASLQNTIFKFYPDLNGDTEDMRMICCVLRSPLVFKSEETIMVHPDTQKKIHTHHISERKIGIHLVWPFLFATQQDMCNLRAAMLRDLLFNCGERPSTSNPWSDVIDGRIYFPNRCLRMVYSDKVNRCERCRNKAMVCLECENARNIKCNRRYLPSSMADGKGNIKSIDDSQNYLKYLSLCSIRRPKLKASYIHGEEPIPDDLGNIYRKLPIVSFKVPPDFSITASIIPPWQPFLTKKNDGTFNGLADKELNFLIKRAKFIIHDHAQVRIEDKKEYREGSSMVEEVQHYLRSSFFCKEYRDISVIFCGEYESIRLKRFYLVLVNGKGSRFCQNINRDHSSKKIFFLITRSYGCQQFCFCECLISKRSNCVGAVMCKFYSSPGVMLTPVISMRLFPAETMKSSATKSVFFPNNSKFVPVPIAMDTSFMFRVKDNSYFPGGTLYEFNTSGELVSSFEKRVGEKRPLELNKENVLYWFPGDSTMIHDLPPPPPGFHYIPANAIGAPASPEDALAMFKEASKEEKEEKILIGDKVLKDLVGTSTQQ